MDLSRPLRMPALTAAFAGLVLMPAAPRVPAAECEAPPAALRPVASTGTGLLLEPPVDLSQFTRAEFDAAMATVGAEKVNREWTAAVTPLPPHLRRGEEVLGLTEAEVKDYMLTVRRLFEEGKSAPVSDVGLISTQEDVIRRPMLNHVAAFANEAVRVYLLVQRTVESQGWGYFSIVQDLTTQPVTDYFAEIKGEAEVKFEAVSCYKCHASGPLAIHPAREDLVSDPALLAALNRHIAKQPLSRMHYPAHDPAPASYGELLALDACAKCHDEGEERAPLYKVHAHSIRVLVDYGHMPPGLPLKPGELAELKAWLEAKP